MTYADYESHSFLEQTEQLLEPTNVWQAGLILRCLVTLETPVQAVWLGDGTSDTTYSLDNHPAASHYDADLIKLIEDCLQYECARRPTFESLLARIEILTGGDDNGKDLSQSHRTADRWRTGGPGIQLQYGDRDKDAIGFVWPAAPPPHPAPTQPPAPTNPVPPPANAPLPPAADGEVENEVEVEVEVNQEDGADQHVEDVQENGAGQQDE